MTRKSANADRLMIESAKSMISKTGCTGLRIREVVERAGVNLGMFHYHFRSKKKFTRILLQEYYEDFFGRLSLASKEGPDGISQLRNVLVAIGLFFKQEHEMYLGIIKDITNEDPQVLAFLRDNAPRHIAILQELIGRCQKEGSMVKVPIPQALSFLLTSLNFPTLIGYVLLKRSKSHAGHSCLVSDVGIHQRIDFALKGLRP